MSTLTRDQSRSCESLPPRSALLFLQVLNLHRFQMRWHQPVCASPRSPIPPYPLAPMVCATPAEVGSDAEAATGKLLASSTASYHTSSNGSRRAGELSTGSVW